MKAAYRISEADYVRATKLYARPSLRGIGVVLTIVLILGGTAAFAPPLFDSLAFGGLIGLAIIVPVMHYIVVPLRSRLHYRRYKAMHDEATVELLEDGLRFTSAIGEGKLPWNYILKWRQNDDYILVYPMPKLFYVVPKSIASNGFDVSALAGSLARHVGSPV
jgi:hypothetical protein